MKLHILSAYGPIALGYELGLRGGDGLLRRQRIRAWALRVHAELEPGLPLVPPMIQARSVADLAAALDRGGQ